MDDRYIDALKAIAEPNRLRLFWLLLQINERICVAEAMDVLGETHYNVSRNLKTLLKAGLVRAEKDGKWVFYTLSPKDNAFYISLEAMVRTIPEHEFKDEINKCRLRLSLRQDGSCVLGADSAEWTEISRSVTSSK
ncbi:MULTISPECIES: ArsR/SmtB family transcription factor [Pacificibacter]|uniref:ArsR/SmtB family transcription factor n=1 Tax=Pacificibacter TaxID=1042323 RepID=UPI001C09FA02|nr:MULTISPECIES: metalloregulator ArsR/SmtB family transcription factor [Pacificibacter]MBU2936361.1 metalloregulator ArsR/SmtB family transcription factor [Pacificibacter marinus]MDO6616601.1 metalloregulator ArsR/SmtB family transcription factor [Pacificibacter sp. 1_MG-2023]